MWHELHATIRAPRFNAEGIMVEEAVAESISIDGTVLHLDVPLGPVEARRSPLAIIGSQGPIGIADIRIKPLDTEWSGNDGWTLVEPMDWKMPDGGDAFSLDHADNVLRGPEEGTLVLCGPLPDDVSIRARIRINEGGRAVLTLGDTSIALNNSVAWNPRTGSINGNEIYTELLAPELPFSLRIDRRRRGDESSVQVFVNGVLINEWAGPHAVEPSTEVLALTTTNPEARLEIEALQWRPLGQ
jgi:hypothetical protein